MPHRESYGRVFTEAILARVPRLILKGRTIDGYLPDGELTLAADPADTCSIKDAHAIAARQTEIVPKHAVNQANEPLTA